MSTTYAHALMAVFESTLKMRVEVSFPEAVAFFRVLGSYNELNGQKVCDLLEAIDMVIPRAEYPDVGGRMNPNNGNRTYTIEIGRESSPVLYVRRTLWSNEEPLNEESITEIEKLARVASADEVGYSFESKESCRRRMNGHSWIERTSYESSTLSSFEINTRQEVLRIWWD